jgi:tellurite resistance protein TerC
LAFIGVKLVLHALHTNELPFINGGEGFAWAPEIPTSISLFVILATIVIATVLSLWTPLGRKAAAKAEAAEAEKAAAKASIEREQESGK